MMIMYRRIGKWMGCGVHMRVSNKSIGQMGAVKWENKRCHWKKKVKDVGIQE
jgi:hypothetical protein